MTDHPQTALPVPARPDAPASPRFVRRPQPRGTRAAGVLAAGVLLAAGVAGSARAAVTLAVNDLRDLPDHDLLDGTCDADATAAGDQVTLRAAVMHANQIGGDVEIILAAQVHGLDRWGTDDASRWGDLDVFSNGLVRLTFTGAPGLSVIDASALDAQGFPDRVLDLRPTLDPQAEVVLDGVTISGGAGVLHGGGIRHQGGALRTIDMTVSSNRSNERGGGLYANAPGTLVIQSSTFEGNESVDGAGACFDTGAAVTVSGSTFSANVASDDGGGAWVRSGFVSFDGTTFKANQAVSGGGVQVKAAASFSGCALLENEASSQGGGLEVDFGGTASADATTFEQNLAGTIGGGISTGALSTFEMKRCRVHDNTALDAGGGIATSALLRVDESSITHNTVVNAGSGGGGLSLFGATEIRNATIAHNEALTGAGGGVRAVGNQPKWLSHVTVARNVGFAGGGGIWMDPVFGPATLGVTGVVLAANSANGVPHWNVAGVGLSSLGGNLDTDGTGGLAGPGDLSGTVAAPIDAMLDPLALHGGATEVMPLQPGSPAIGLAPCVDPAGNVVGADQHGRPRVAPCDAGAWESLAALGGACPIPLAQLPDGVDGVIADADCPGCPSGIAQSAADDIVVAGPAPVRLRRMVVHGGYDGIVPPASDDTFRVRILIDAGGIPGPPIAETCRTISTRTATGATFGPGLTEYVWAIDLPATLEIPPGPWFVEIFNDTSGAPGTSWVIETATMDPLAGRPGAAVSFEAPGIGWLPVPQDLALELQCGTPLGCLPDLNGNAQVDFADVLSVVAAWGATCSPADLDGDGIVGFGDLLTVLGAFGPCP